MASRRQTLSTRFQVAEPAYEDFQPKSDWVEDAAANVLTFYLPGFNKDQIKITYDEKPPKMTIRGERPLGNNIISRFSKDFPIPENCKINEMKAKFDQRQVLTLTMPKKNITPPTAQPKDTASQKASPETNLRPKPQDEKMSPPAPRTTAAAAGASSTMGKEPEKKTDEKVTGLTPIPKAPSLHEPETQKEPPSKAALQKQADNKVPESFDPLDSTSRPRPQKSWEETSLKAPLLPDVQKPKEDWRKTESGLQQVDQKVGHQESKDLKEKDQSQSKASSSQVLDRIGKESGDLTSAAKKAVFGLDQERRLLVNAGMAVLVIVAVGAYFGYKLGSSSGSHHKN